MKHFLILLLVLSAAALPAQYAVDLYVAADGSAEYATIQGAVDATKAFPDRPITIHVKNGVYVEKVEIFAWNPDVTLRGESADSTILRYGDYFDGIARGRNSTFHTATLLVRGDNFRAENLTVENTTGPVGQAVAVAVEADRAEFHHCRFLGNQDTLYADGANARQYYRNCYIEGTTDFIFGAATALFENCTIHSKSDSYVTAASTPAGRDYGFVFLDCRLTAAPGVDQVYLGRPWRDHARTVFINCELGDHILPVGWDNWSSPEREKTTFYAEYRSTGPGAAPAARASWSHQLSKRAAARYTKTTILKPFLLPAMGGDPNPR
ncbi:pectinesterase family protein [Lewinella sp. IMCC34183]|uniref:pectinesterase family protein n=1 Tax=Lewinella sp. IMCC34183 TaxID=2248762 RepID=UPI000E22E46B|nr:pectinesterase family protein [Lewinella sp. IMCC34183]